MTTLIAPFPSDANYHLLSGQGLSPVDFERYDSVRLAGLPISSNSTGMVHSEQMFPLDGPIRRGISSVTRGEQIENHSKLTLHSVCVLKRLTPDESDRKKHEFDGRWIGDLLPGQSLPLVMASLPSDKPPFADDRATEARTHGRDRLNLEPMFRLALDQKNIDKGEMRLVGRIDELLPGEAVTPSASQIRGATLVVAHLKYGPLPTPEKDRNTKQDIKSTEQSEENGPIEL